MMGFMNGDQPHAPYFECSQNKTPEFWQSGVLFADVPGPLAVVYGGRSQKLT